MEKIQSSQLKTNSALLLQQLLRHLAANRDAAGLNILLLAINALKKELKAL